MVSMARTPVSRGSWMRGRDRGGGGLASRGRNPSTSMGPNPSMGSPRALTTRPISLDETQATVRGATSSTVSPDATPWGGSQAEQLQPPPLEPHDLRGHAAAR